MMNLLTFLKMVQVI